MRFPWGYQPDAEELALAAEHKREESAEWARVAAELARRLGSLDALIAALKEEPAPWTREGKGLQRLRENFERACLCRVGVVAASEEEAGRIFDALPEREKKVAVVKIVEPTSGVYYIRDLPRDRRPALRLAAPRAPRSSSRPSTPADPAPPDSPSDGPSAEPTARLACALHHAALDFLRDRLIATRCEQEADDEHGHDRPCTLTSADAWRRADHVARLLAPAEEEITREADWKEGEAGLADALVDYRAARAIVATWIRDLVEARFHLHEDKLDEHEYEVLWGLLASPDEFDAAVVAAWEQVHHA